MPCKVNDRDVPNMDNNWFVSSELQATNTFSPQQICEMMSMKTARLSPETVSSMYFLKVPNSQCSITRQSLFPCNTQEQNLTECLGVRARKIRNCSQKK